MKILLVLLLVISCQNKIEKTSTYKGFGSDSVDEATLLKFAPKPIATQKLKKIESYMDIRSTGLGELSPDGKFLVFSWDVTGVRQLWRINGPQKFPIQLTGGQDKASLFEITPDGKYLVISRDEKGSEQPGIFLQSSDGGELKTVFKKEKVRAFPEFLTKDSRYLFYRANDISPETYAIYRYDIENDKRDLVFKRDSGTWLVADNWGSDLLLMAKWKGNTSSEYYTYRVSTKELTPIIGQNEDEEYYVSFGQSQNDFILITNKFSEFRKLYHYKNNKIKELVPNLNYDIDEFKIDQARSRLLYLVNENGYMKTKGLKLSNFNPLQMPSFNEDNILHVFPGSTTVDGSKTIFGVVTANAPSTAYMYNWKTKKKEKWTLPSSPEVSTKNFVAPTLESYPARDGTQIPMFVWRPKGCVNKVCPVIVNFHGGPESQAKPWFSPRRELYLEQGYIFVAPNVRGSDGYGKAWLHSDNGPKRLDVITDIADAGLYIKKSWAKDGVIPKVAALGGSYGGYSTFMAMTMFAGVYEAGVAVVGMSSLLSFLENTAPYRRHLRTSEYGDPEKDREALLKLSAITYLDKIKDPLLIIHGATDPRVPAGEAIQIYNVMEEKGLPGELILFADEGHGIRKRKNQVLYLGHIIEFLNKHLK